MHRMMTCNYGMGPFSPFMMLLMAAIIIIPFWFIFAKAGYSKWISLLMVVPLVNIMVLFFLAFSQWPVLVKQNNSNCEH